jgi:uncharacterized membrane protein
MERMKGAVKRTFFTGLVVVVPILITAFALYWLFRVLDGFLNPIIPQILGREIPGLGILTEIVIIFLVGVVATNVLGSRILNWFQSLLMRAPVVKNIYPTIKQLVEAFQPSSSPSFKKVVLVEYPKMGTYAIGFLTSEVSMKGTAQSQRLYSVYLPTNNLYIGNVALFKEEDLIVTDFTVEEGLKIVLSGGTAFPPTIQKQNQTRMP